MTHTLALAHPRTHAWPHRTLHITTHTAAITLHHHATMRHAVKTIMATHFTADIAADQTGCQSDTKNRQPFTPAATATFTTTTIKRAISTRRTVSAFATLTTATTTAFIELSTTAAFAFFTAITMTFKIRFVTTLFDIVGIFYGFSRISFSCFSCFISFHHFVDCFLCRIYS